MSNLTYKIIEARIKMHIKAYAVLILIMVISMGFYSYKKWQEYKFVKVGLEKAEERLVYLKEEGTKEKTNYDSKKKSFDKLNETIEQQLGKIFPKNDSYTDLTRYLDNYEIELNSRKSPFAVSNIEYQDVIKVDNYSILPVRMTIRSSRNNFTKFLHLIENSGSVSNNIRLMDISSIRLNFEQNEGDGESPSNEEEIINFSVQINAYFQTS